MDVHRYQNNNKHLVPLFFTGHIGCGKSTELLRLKTELEQQGFHVVYFESSQDLDMADVDISDILLAIASSCSNSNRRSICVNLCHEFYHQALSPPANLPPLNSWYSILPVSD